ncbi:hypothetical protein CMALT430_230012 [Carnobacterium maltaromaticum]|nr:hypothetical protein CMALT430_230012 [Carnobacterium maltaromaticum]
MIRPGKKIGKIDMALFAISNFYLFLEGLTHKNWPDKKDLFSRLGLAKIKNTQIPFAEI